MLRRGVELRISQDSTTDLERIQRRRHRAGARCKLRYTTSRPRRNRAAQPIREPHSIQLGSPQRVTHLVIGASGQVGHHVTRVLTDQGVRVLGTASAHLQPGLAQLDIRDRCEVLRLVQKIEPEYVFLSAACTNVDYCELNPTEAYSINVLGTKNVADAVRAIGARLVFFSSDYIFDGRVGPYPEDTPGSPISQYGRQKLIGEHLVGLHVEDYLIVRTTVVYSWEPQGKNFVERLVIALRQGKPIRVPYDQISTPTY